MPIQLLLRNIAVIFFSQCSTFACLVVFYFCSIFPKCCDINAAAVSNQGITSEVNISIKAVLVNAGSHKRLY